MSLVLLLDGFDEVSATRGRKAAKQALRIVAEHAGATVILAGRAQAEGACWGDIPRLDRLALTLEPLDRERQLELVGRFDGLLPEQRLVGLRGMLEDGSGRLAELLARPLYLMAAVAVAAVGESELPADAAGLLQAFLPPLVRVCLSDRLERLGGEADELTHGCLAALERLASSAPWLAAGWAGRFSGRQLLAAFQGDFRELVSSHGGADVVLAAVGILDVDPKSRWRFAAFPFQEHLAARGLVRRLAEMGAAELIAELRKAAFTVELPRHLAAVMVHDREIELPFDRRLQVFRMLVDDLARMLGGVPDDWSPTYPSLALALRDELVDLDADALDAWARDEAATLEESDPALVHDPVTVAAFAGFVSSGYEPTVFD